MNSSIYRFMLDLHSTQSQISLPVTLGDTAREFHISLADGGLPYIIADGCLARITIKRPTSTPEQPSFLEAFCAIEGNTTIKYDFEQNKNTAAVEGIHDCSIDLYDAEGKNIGSPRFTMIVSDRVRNSDDITLSDDDVTAIDAMLAAEAARQIAEENRNHADEWRANAEVDRADAEEQRVIAEEAREQAEAERKTAEDGRVSAEAQRAIDAEARREALDTAIAMAAEFEGSKVDRIDLVEYPHGDPTNPNATGDIGNYAGVYTEYYGNDGKWREKLTKSNLAAYSSLSEAAVDKFVGNLKTSRIPITDSNGRLAVPAPQKGANGQTHYYNPEASAATNNTYNAAIPLWYGDERYVRANTYTTDKNATDKKIASLEDAVANAGGGSSAKLYRHDISLYATGDFSDCCFDIRCTIYDSNPNSYAAEKDIDYDNWEVISDIPIEKFSFLPVKTNINASGVFLEIEDIYNDDGEHMGGASVTRIVLSLRFDPDHIYDDKFSFLYDGNALDWSPSYGGGFSISDVEYIDDVVMEVK